MANTESMSVALEKICLNVIQTAKMTVAEDETYGDTLYKKGTILEKNASGKLQIWGTAEAVVMERADAVADAAGSAPTAAEFKALLDSLRDAGILKNASASSDPDPVKTGLAYAILMEDIDCSEADVTANVLLAGKVDRQHLSALTGMTVANSYDELRKNNIICVEVK